jgi:hypothetical protein
LGFFATFFSRRKCSCDEHKKLIEDLSPAQDRRFTHFSPPRNHLLMQSLRLVIVDKDNCDEQREKTEDFSSLHIVGG